jgi:hypothetical protein
MTPTRALQKTIIIVATLFALNAYASSNWILWRQTTSSIMNTRNAKASIAAFDTEAKCEAELEKTLSNNVTQLKAQRVGNSVVYNLGRITYDCVLESASTNNTFSNTIQNNYKRKGSQPNSKQNIHGEF